jgi:hypothetical protein
MMGPVHPTTIPHGRTARRLDWAHLPPHLRREVERRCGSPVVDAQSQDSGYTPGFASVLTCADGSRHFVKAASTTAQRAFAASYREEARRLAVLPPSVPAPRLRWVYDDDWVVLGIEHVAARPVGRPWTDDDLTAALAMAGRVAEQLTPAPAGLAPDRIEVELADWPSCWDRVAVLRPELPGLAEHLAEAAALAAGAPEVLAGDTVVHTDLRDDNILLLPDGRAVACDWNWPVRGAAWVDTVWLLIGPRGDGLDVEKALATSTVTRDVPADHVDALLVLVAGYLLKSAGDPVPPTSPYVRTLQGWQGAAAWGWLAERRGWV